MKRSAPIKRKPPKRRERGTGCQLGRRCIAIGVYRDKRVCAKHWADWLMADHVKAEEGCCRVCGSTENLQWAHVHSRSYGAIRWDRDNSMALCQADHMRFTVRPLEWEQWCRDNGIPWDELRMKALNGPKMQPMFVIERLKQGGEGVAWRT